MKTVSIQELKRHLSELIREAASGVRIVITRHRRAVAFLDSAELRHVRRGRHFGKGKLSRLLDRGSRGRLFAVLADDRHGGRRDR